MLRTLHLGAVALALTVTTGFAIGQDSASLAAPQLLLRLPPGEGNPRNSEGDLIELQDGRLLFIYTRFTGGDGDHAAADLVSRVSSDGGVSWSSEDQMVLPNEAGMNVMSVSLLRLADERIAMFYLRKNSLVDCRPVVRFSTDEAAHWSEPVEVIPDDDTGYFVLNNDRVIQLESGRLLVPVTLHHRPDWEQADWRGVVTVYYSDDSGATWKSNGTEQPAHRPDGSRIAAQEPGVVELVDGRVMMWIRTDAGHQYRADSEDGGLSWTEFEPMGLASPLSPASIERIPGTTDLLAVWNDVSHLPLDERTRRTPLTIAISRDQGETWLNPKPLATDPDGWYCYTAIDFVDETVFVAHVAGQQQPARHLATTDIQRLPLSWCYASTNETLDTLTANFAPAGRMEGEPLVQRERVRLTLHGAQLALAAAKAKAVEMKLSVNIAVADDGGHLLAFARMEGARPASVATSITKATTAATARTATGPLPPGQTTNVQLSLAVESAAAASGGKFTSLKGGIPIVVDEQVIGAVGVGGATGEQDAEISQAGIDALLRALAAPAAPAG